MTDAIRVLLVDDHVIVRKGVRQAIEEAHGICVVGEVGDAEAALNALGRTQPDVVVMDVRLPGMSGVDATRVIQERPGAPAVLILSNYDDDEFVHHVLVQGASGYLLKSATDGELVDAIRRVAAGDAVLPPSIARKVLRHYQAKPQAAPHAALSRRQLEVLLLVASGLSNREIARQLCLSERTVGNHVTAIYQKLDLARRSDAVLYAISYGLIKQPKAPGYLAELPVPLNVR